MFVKIFLLQAMQGLADTITFVLPERKRQFRIGPRGIIKIKSAFLAMLEFIYSY